MAGSRAAAAAAASLVLFMALLAFLASTSEAAETARAFGVKPPSYVPCCVCACTRPMNPHEMSRCSCGGVWYQRCPSACSHCDCDYRGRCVCRDGLSISYDLCQANSCYQLFSGADAAASAAAREVAAGDEAKN